uniref:RELT like 2 n=1 Tax=Chelonoidis abingdonii TaxID=106734 RepID=A0A8C0J205_CHEAB
MSEQNSTSDGDADSHHSMSMLLLLVLIFFTMGLVGFLICHVLKKKGYRCRTFRDELDLELQPPNEEEELNEDTVEKIVRCIIQNEGGCFLAPARGAFPSTWLPHAFSVSSLCQQMWRP